MDKRYFFNTNSFSKWNSIFIVNRNKEIICLNILDGGTRWVLPIDDELSNDKKYFGYPLF